MFRFLNIKASISETCRRWMHSGSKCVLLRFLSIRINGRRNRLLPRIQRPLQSESMSSGCRLLDRRFRIHMWFMSIWIYRRRNRLQSGHWKPLRSQSMLSRCRMLQRRIRIQLRPVSISNDRRRNRLSAVQSLWFRSVFSGCSLFSIR